MDNSSKPLHILHICTYKYTKALVGGPLGVFHTINSVAQFAKVHCLVVQDQADDPTLKPTFTRLLQASKLRYINPLPLFKAARMLKQNSADLIWVEHCYFTWFVYLLKKICRKPLVVRSHNVEFLRFKSIGKWWWPILKYYERWSCKVADATMCITQADADLYKAHGFKGNFIYAPFGIGVAAPPSDKLICKEQVQKRHHLSSDTKILLFASGLAYGPNIHALEIILDKLNPLLKQRMPNYKFLICGAGLADSYNKLEAYKADNIIYCGYVDDIEQYFKAADVFVSPVVGGGGIKTKIVEAIAFGTSVVSSEDGAKGFEYDCAGKKLKVCADDDAAAMCDAIVAILNDEYQTTPQSFYDTYFRDNQSKRLVEQLKQLVSNKR